MSDSHASQPSDRQARLEQVLADYLHSVENGQPLDRWAMIASHPELADDLRSFFHNRDSIDRLAVPLKAAADAPTLLGKSEMGPLQARMTVRYFGDYELLTEIARGGMGVVYKARQVNLNRVVALKMILAGQFANDSDVKRFYAEAEAAAKLDHPGIVPIFEIGQHDGQHYFSMAFIEGESLAKKVANGPLPPREAATLVKTIAEAVEYAHQRGIIHRDLKPANVLLDQTGQPRVTDFGLAKQLQGDSGLTGTGQILGTPSYMPPEQAAGKVDQVGPAADVYSLGAILYCLLTGRPPFQAASPMDTLMQVLEQEPVSVRQLNAQVSRDLDTIALKCLVKNPRGRYATAQGLADDLTAFVENRAISARRASVAERTVRWFRRQKRSVVVAASAAVAAIVIVIACLIGTGIYARSQLGYLQLNVATLAGDRPEVADVLNEQGELQQTISLPMREAVSLPKGAYQVRLAGTGRLSETYRVDVAAGDRESHEVTLADAPLWKLSLNSPQTCGFIKIAGEARVVVGPQDTALPIVACYSGHPAIFGGNVVAASPALLWKADWSPDSPRLATLLGAPEQRTAWQQFVATWSQSGQEPRLVQPAPDLDGDGTGDLAWWYSNGVVAVSSRDGHPLWWFRPTGSSGAPGQLAAPPIVFVPQAPAEGADSSRAVIVVLCLQGNETWLEAISSPAKDAPAGQVGQAVPDRVEVRWRQSLAPDVAATAAPFADCALSLCRIAGRPVVVCVAGRQLAGVDPVTGEPAWPMHDLGVRPASPAAFVDLDADGQEEILLVHPEKSGDHPLQAIALAPEGPRELWQATVHHLDSRIPTMRQMPARRMMHWPEEHAIVWSLRDASEAAPWPFLVDLDSDRQPEIVVPAKGYGGRLNQTQRNGVVVLEGTTGKVRWERHWPTHSIDQQLGYFHPVQDAYASGPDLDGDGLKELFVVSIYDEQHRENVTKSEMMYRFRGEEFLYIDCLSGRDGQSLWWSREPLGGAGSLGGVIGPLVWWGADADGLPQLVVPVIRHLDVPVERAYVVSAATGRVTRILRDVTLPVAADFDSDGLADLVTFQPDDPHTFEMYYGQGESGKLRVVRGDPPEAFRRLGPWAPMIDIDGDGQPELIRQGEPVHNQTLAVASGFDGRILRRWRVEWRDRRDDHGDVVLTHPLPRGDFDGDGIADLAVSLPNRNLDFWPQTPAAGFRCALPLQALAGKTGLPIWREPAVLLPAMDDPDLEWKHAFRKLPRARVLRVTDVDRDGRPELLCDVSWDAIRASQEIAIRSQRYLALISAQDGALLWSEPYGEFVMQTQTSFFPWFDLALPNEFFDLDGDGVHDIVFVAPQLNADNVWSFAAEARSGRDGRRLWRTPLLYPGTRGDPAKNAWLVNPTSIRGSFQSPVVGDLDGDGRAEVVLHEMPQGQPDSKMSLLRGDTGERLWSRAAAEHAVILSIGDAGPSNPENPVAARRGVAAMLSPASANPGVVLLDKAGTELEHAPPCGMWAFDLDGDGHEELVTQRANRLQAHRRGLNNLLWEWTAPEGAPIISLDVLPGNRPALVAATGDWLFILDAATGRSQMRTRKEDLSTRLSQTGFSLGRRDSPTIRDLPCLADRHMGRGSPLALTVSRRLVPTNPDGTFLALSPGSRVESRRFIAGAAGATDPRLVRQLPWVPTGRELSVISDYRLEFIFAACGIVASPLIVIIIPIRLIRGALRQGQTLRLRALRISGAAALAVGAVVIATVVGPVVFPIGATFQWQPYLGLAFMFLPAIVWPSAVLRLIRGWKWKSLAALLLATLAASILSGYWLIEKDRPALDSDAHYHLHYIWDGWWIILFVGAWGAGWLLIAVRLLGPPLKWMRRRTIESLK